MVQWLEHGLDIYWISGKAGSGKSTLLKFLYEHQKTKDLLTQWSGDSPLTMANFFFYALGVDEQKTQEGLVRSLLYQILTAESKLIQVLLPNMWRDAHISDSIQLSLPSTGESMEAFSAIKKGSRNIAKICFLYRWPRRVRRKPYACRFVHWSDSLRIRILKFLPLAGLFLHLFRHFHANRNFSSKSLIYETLPAILTRPSVQIALSAS